MKNLIFISIIMLLFTGCNRIKNEDCDALAEANSYTENNIKIYKTAWNTFFETRDRGAINTDSFDEQVTAVTAEGNVTGIEAFREYYGNYLTGFSDAEFKFIDIFGDGDKLVKHWNFKGTHDGDLFGIPATNNKVDINGTTIVLMKDGRILQEQDFFDNYSFLMQLGLLQ